jgi:hypothetical protein
VALTAVGSGHAARCARTAELDALEMDQAGSKA